MNPKKSKITPPKKLFLIFYIILALTFIIIVTDLILFLIIEKSQTKFSPVEINLNGAPEELQQEINNLIK